MELLKSIKSSCGVLKSLVRIDQAIADLSFIKATKYDYEKMVEEYGRLALANEILPKVETVISRDERNMTYMVSQSCYVFSKKELDEYTLAVYNLGINSVKVL